MANEGMKGLYRGYNITAFCVPFFNMIYFPLYETIKEESKARLGFEEGSFLLYATSASASGVICNCISNPLWMVRTRMQAEIFRSMSEDNYRSKYPINIFKTLQIIK